jgi:hypothetical protein
MRYDDMASLLFRLEITHRLCVTVDKISEQYPDGNDRQKGE